MKEPLLILTVLALSGCAASAGGEWGGGGSGWSQPPVSGNDAGGSGDDAAPQASDDASAPVGDDASAGDAGNGATADAGAFDNPLPSDGAWANDSPSYKSAHDLCDYVNQGRTSEQGHERYQGFPWKGQYDTTHTWPLTFTVDPALNAIAQAEADRLVNEGGPKGQSTTDSSWRKPFYIDGIDTAVYQLTSQDQPGDWNFQLHTASTPAFILENGSARQGLFYQDPGGQGPVLTKLGCGAAYDPNGPSKWWVVVLRP